RGDKCFVELCNDGMEVMITFRVVVVDLIGKKSDMVKVGKMLGEIMWGLKKGMWDVVECLKKYMVVVVKVDSCMPFRRNWG
ncbi:hypothetical protein, partial [Paenibacillus xylanexedens]|uniref:hypothetical protein n=1 Tax=Paenibacillus xylanexedens TaxID=528191 RepID=UPI001C9303A3